MGQIWMINKYIDAAIFLVTSDTGKFLSDCVSNKNIQLQVLDRAMLICNVIPFVWNLSEFNSKNADMELEWILNLIMRRIYR